MTVSSTLVASQTSLLRSKAKSTGIYSKAKVCFFVSFPSLAFAIKFPPKDPTPLRTFAADLRAVHHARSQPSMKQQSALSSAQQLVRAARRAIIEPVLASLELSSDSSDEEQQPAPDNLPGARERAQMRRIHLRKSGLTVRASGVHILRNLEDESADVDIATDGEPLASNVCGIKSLPSPQLTGQPAVSNSTVRSPRLSRPRRPLPTRPHLAKAKLRSLKTKPISDPDRVSLEPSITKKEKPKSETYKQAWSISEQHLLERLLAEIPDGEKNRYVPLSSL
jgi:hypothetical protein